MCEFILALVYGFGAISAIGIVAGLLDRPAPPRVRYLCDATIKDLMHWHRV